MLFQSHRLLLRAAPDMTSMANPSASSLGSGLLDAMNDHSSHPDFGYLCLLVFEAVMEVVCVSLPGYIVARQGMFDANAQKFVANLNVQLFTPCLSMSLFVPPLRLANLCQSSPSSPPS